MNLKELIEYYDSNINKISATSKHYDSLFLIRSKVGSGKITNEPHINGKHYWMNNRNTRDANSYEFFYIQNINAYEVSFNGTIAFSAHISVISILGRNNFGVDYIGGYYLYNKKKIRNVNKIAKLCVNKLRSNNYDCVIEPCKDGISMECVLLPGIEPLKYEPVSLNANIINRNTTSLNIIFNSKENDMRKSIKGEWVTGGWIDSSRKAIKSGNKSFGITPEQNKFNWAYNDWYGHFHMNLDRVPQYLEGVKWCNANKGSEFYNELCEKYNIYPTGDWEKAAFYNALKKLGEIESVTSSRKPIKSSNELNPNMFEYCYNTIETIVRYHNKNLTKKQYYALDDLLDKMKNHTATSDDCVNVLEDIVNYHNKNLTKPQYYALSDLLDGFKAYDDVSTNDILSSRKPVKSGRYIKSGAGAGYDVTIKGIELDDSNYTIISDEITDEAYNEHVTLVEVPVKPCIAEYWSAQSYYDGIDSDYEYFDYDEDSKIEGGKATLKLYWYEHEEGRNISDVEYESADEAAQYCIPRSISIKVLIGAGWIHANLPVESVHFEDRYTSNHGYGIDEYNDGYDYETMTVDLICPNICQNINAFFENPEQYYDDYYENDEDDDIYSSRKPVKSSQEMESQHYDVLDNYGGTVGFDMTLEDANDLAEDIDGIVVPVESSRKPIQSRITQRELKDMIRTGQAIDITYGDAPEGVRLDVLQISKGTYGMNGALFKGSDGNLYVIGGRTTNLFRYV